MQNHNASPAKDGPVSVAYGMKKDWFRWKIAGVYCTLMYFDFITVIPRHGNSSRYLLRLSIWSDRVGIKTY